MNDRPTISLILATVGRTDELRRYLDSLGRQTFTDAELIVVDQNEDDRLVPLLMPLRSVMTVRHLRAPRGLSRARNNGLAVASGAIIAFPDDDCWYAPDLLQQIKDRFKAHPEAAGWSGMTRDADGRPSGSRWASVAGWITKRNVWMRAMSPAIFLSKEAVDAIGRFNESLGVGAGTDWGSGEETDYLLRGVGQGLKIMYDPDLVVFHPQVEAHRTPAARSRARSYGMGFGWVLRRHRFPVIDVLYHWIRPWGGSVLALATGDLVRAKFSLDVGLGRIRGYCTATPLD